MKKILLVLMLLLAPAVAQLPFTAMADEHHELYKFKTPSGVQNTQGRVSHNRCDSLRMFVTGLMPTGDQEDVRILHVAVDIIRGFDPEKYTRHETVIHTGSGDFTLVRYLLVFGTKERANKALNAARTMLNVNKDTLTGISVECMIIDEE